MFTINQLSKIYTACQVGQIPFVSADDIAEVAFCTLTTEKSFNCDLRILGPELLTYDDVSFNLHIAVDPELTQCLQVAAKLTKVLGRHIEHVKLNAEGRYENLIQAGLSRYYAQFYTNVETKAAEGLETALNSVVEDITGHGARSLDDFLEKNKVMWSM